MLRPRRLPTLVLSALAALAALLGSRGGVAAAGASTLRITLLGTAGPFFATSTTERAEAGLLVQAGSETLLFDCGRGIPERLAQLGASAVSKVFLSHLHSDHTEGLPLLWMDNSNWRARGETPLSIFGPGRDTDQPSGTVDLTAQLAIAFATNTHIRRDVVEHLPAGGIQFQAKDISEGIVYANNGVTVTAFLVNHAPVRPAFGYRVDYAGHSMVFSGDTTFSDNLVKYAQSVDVLVHEVYITTGPGRGANAVEAYHSSPEQAGDVFRRAGPKLAVYTHIIGPTEALVTRTRAAGYVGPLELGQDLTAVEVGDTVSIQRCASPTTPVITAVTNDRLDSRIAVGDTIVVSGSGFSTAGNALMWTPAGNASGQASVTLDESGGLFFRNQSAGEIDAAPGPGLTKGQWTLRVRSGCSVSSAAVSVTIR